MSGLRFRFSEMYAELDTLATLAEPFLAPESRLILPAFKRALEGFQTTPTAKPIVWQIDLLAPLKTRADNRYEQGKRQGAHKVHAELSCIWEIRRIVEGNVRRSARQFELVGKASTRVALISEDQKQIAMWRVEIGDSQSPGCHFHVQVLGQTPDFPFPSTLPVPRLLSLMATPAAAFEYVLAELFQNEWVMHMSRENDFIPRWAAIQRKRWLSLLNWKLGLIGAGGSPWVEIKTAKPDAKLFI